MSLEFLERVRDHLVMNCPNVYEFVNIDILFENVNISIDFKCVICDNQAINRMRGDL